MHPYLALVAVSSLACAACAGAIYAHPRERRNGIAAALALLGLAYWGACQLLYHIVPDPQTALWIARASAPGWVFLGPLCLRVFLPSQEFGGAGLQRVWVGLMLAAVSGLVLTLATPWMIESLRPAPWGRGVDPGPLFAPVCGLIVMGACVGLRLSRQAQGRFSKRERVRRRGIALAIAVPVAVVSTTDVFFPMLGVVFPPMAPTLFGPLAVLTLWLRASVGYSPLVAAHVATEMLEVLPDGVALLYADDRVRLVNQGLVRMTGTPAERLEGMPISELLRSGSEGSEWGELVCASGQCMPVSVKLSELRDKSGNRVGRVVVVRDLREVADLRNRLVTSGRLAAVGELAAGIAHEINNPLAFVRSNLTQLEDCWKRVRVIVPPASDEEPLADLVKDCDELIEESLEGVDRAVEIVRGVRNFAHAGSDEREQTDLKVLLEDTLRVASSQLRNRVNVLREYEPSLPPVQCAPQQLRQVFLNLVVNAAQAVEEGGSVLVATRTEGDDVIVSVADDGCGIAPEYVDRIFDPFFTTKRVGEGTGLGLGIAHQIVSSHDGEIAVETEPGLGTVFRVRLPAARA